MFKFSSRTAIHENMKMSDVLKLIKADKETKIEAQNISSIVMINALSEITTGLKPSAEVNEIYVIKIVLKNDQVPHKFLTSLDKSIRFQVLYVLEFDGKIKYLTGFKTIKDKILQAKTFESDWQEENLQDMPLVSNLTDLYKAMLTALTDLHFRKDEPIREWLQRWFEIERLEKEFARYDKLLKAEVQPKKQFKYKEIQRNIYHKLRELKRYE